jgi:hypothetical protein
VYHDQAGDQARHSTALDAAVRFYQAALEQWPALDRAASQTSMCGHARFSAPLPLAVVYRARLSSIRGQV